MNWIDYTILVIIAGGAINGFTKGIIRQVIGLVSFSAGFIIASQHYEDLAQRLPFIDDHGMANIVAYAIIVVGITAAGNFIGHLLHRIVGFMMFGLFDKALGAAFGAFLNVLFIEVALLLLSSLQFVGTDTLDSTLVRKFLDFAPLVAQFLPPDFDPVRQTMGTLR